MPARPHLTHPPTESATLARPLHIVHTESSCGWGGQEIRILEESRGLMARGHRVTILAPESATIYQRAAQWGVPAVALPLTKKRFAPLLAMRHWLQQHGQTVDVINTHSSTDSWLAAVALRLCGLRIPIVRTRHISAPVKASWMNRWLYARAAMHVVTTGEQLRLDLIQRLGVAPAACSSIVTGIDTARFTPADKAAARAELGLAPAAFWVGIVATLRSWKGHRFLLEALAALPDTPLRLVIVGDGPQREALAARVTELGLGERVVFAGEQKNVAPWLQALDVFALPSYANEGVSQSVMQAMATGLPVVTTAVGSMRDVIEHGKTGLLVAPKNIDALQQALLRLLQEPALAAELGQSARAFALRHCGITQMLDRMETVFQHAVLSAGRLKSAA